MKGHWTYSVGQKLGSLTLVQFLGNSTWLVHCECGNDIQVSSNHLYRKKSCGCKSISNRFKVVSDEEMLVSLKFGHYKQSAYRRQLTFTLTTEDVKSFIFNNCFYCGDKPQKTSTRKNHNSTEWNGIDRKDNTKGYHKDNCVTCCYRCNFAKHTSSHEEFVEWIKRLVKKWSK